MNKEGSFIVAAVVVALTGLGLWYWYGVEGPTPISTSVPTPTTLAPVVESPPRAASEPAIIYPIESFAAASDPEVSPLKLEMALTDLFGRKTVLTLFQLDDFARLAVTTIDNLGRTAAPARLWPLNPAGGRFTVIKQGEAETISSDNGLRYTPYVLLLENVDVGRAVALYRRFYAQFQQAYDDLSSPRRHFNDRLVEVIDLLVATPETGEAIKVHLPPIDGPIQPERPWVRYEFDDPMLQSLSAGQRILIRMGLVNQRRVKAKLTEIRARVTAGTPGR
ncbi:MAG: DUF3014 domain-containing protein [Nitrospirales bacterium]